MTYRDLLEQIDQLEEDQLDFQVVAYVDDEFFRVSGLQIHEEKDSRLDDGHPYLEVE